MPIRQGHHAPCRLEPGLPLILLALGIVAILSPNLRHLIIAMVTTTQMIWPELCTG
jgi:hypothetical protein